MGVPMKETKRSVRTTAAVRATARILVLGSAAAWLLSAPTRAVDFQKGKLEGSWDTTLSWGAQFRLDEADNRLVGLANGGTAFRSMATTAT